MVTLRASLCGSPGRCQGIIQDFVPSRGYGFIALSNGAWLYFDRAHVYSDVRRLTPGVPVVFTPHVSEDTGRHEARDVRLVADVVHPDDVKALAESTDPRLWKPLLVRYLLQLPRDQAIATLERKRPALTDPELVGIAKALPVAWLSESPRLRTILGYDPRIELYEEKLRRSHRGPERDAIADLLADVLDSYGSQGWSCARVSRQSLERSVRLRRRAPARVHIDVLAGLIRRHSTGDRYLKLRSELLQRLRDDDAWDVVPDDILSRSDILSQAPSRRRARYLADKLTYTGSDEVGSCVSQLAEDLANLSAGEALQIVEILPPWLDDVDILLRFRSPRSQVDIVWRHPISTRYARWRYLSWQAKILMIYRLAFERSLRTEQLPDGDDNPFVAAVLDLLAASRNTVSKGTAFRWAHERIQDAIVTNAWTSTAPFDLSPLLPPCTAPNVPVAYCEGRSWPDKEAIASDENQTDRAYCPRARTLCWTVPGPLSPKAARSGSILRGARLFNDVLLAVGPDGASAGSILRGARLFSDVSRPWWDWSLQELLAYLEIEPRLPDLRDPQDYVGSLSGWVNRLNEIRERLACRSCGGIMTTNMKYAKHLAVYRSTVFSCPHGAGHDVDVYLSHCWACRGPIDSRDCPIYVDGYRVCLACGSGPQKSQTYRQGTICPKCGARDMREIGAFGRRLQCAVCQHIIKLPPSEKLTGPPLACHSSPSATAPDGMHDLDDLYLEDSYWPYWISSYSDDW